MGMKETHFLPEDQADWLNYFRTSTYFGKLNPSDNGVYWVDHLTEWDENIGRGAYFIAFHKVIEDNVMRSYLNVVSIIRDPESDENGVQAYMLDWVPEYSAINFYPPANFLLKLYHDPDDLQVNQYRMTAWVFALKGGEELSSTQKVLGHWLYTYKTHNLLQSPNLVMRLSGEWNGWKNTPGVEYDHKRYDFYEKEDAIEDEAFELYKALVQPLKLMPKSRHY